MIGTLEEDNILGETQMPWNLKFYNRKANGQSNRINGSKLTPDEKKRRQYIIHKKNEQQRPQQVK